MNRLVIVGGGSYPWPISKGKVLSFSLADDYERQQPDYNADLNSNMYQNYFQRSKSKFEHQKDLDVPNFNLVLFLGKFDLIVFGYELREELYISDGYVNLSVNLINDADNSPIPIPIPQRPLSLTSMDGERILVLYQNHQPVTRSVISISPTKHFTFLKTLQSQSLDALRDLSADSIESQKSFTRKQELAILTFNAMSGSENYLSVEFVDSVTLESIRTFKLERRILNESKRIEAVWGIPQIHNQGIIKIIPYSEYVAVARKGSQNILLHYYGENSLSSRIIRTKFTSISDLKVGQHEKLLHVFDSSVNTLAQFILPEIGCPTGEGVSGCSKYFMNQDVVCAPGSNKEFNSVLLKCNCKPGFFQDSLIPECRPCNCPYSSQTCVLNATDCGDTPFFRYNAGAGEGIEKVCVTNDKMVLLSNSQIEEFRLNLRRLQTEQLTKGFFNFDTNHQTVQGLYCFNGNVLMSGQSILVDSKKIPNRSQLSPQIYTRYFEGKQVLDLIEMTYLAQITLEFIAASTQEISEDLPVRYAFGVLQEGRIRRFDDKALNYQVRFEVDFPVSAIASFEELVPNKLQFFPLPTDFYTLVVFAPNTQSDLQLKIFSIDLQQSSSWTSQFQVPLKATIPKLLNDVYIKMKILRDFETPLNLVLVSVTQGKKIVFEYLGVGEQKTEDRQYSRKYAEQIPEIQGEEVLIGAEILSTSTFVVACTDLRKCVVVDFKMSPPDKPYHRLISIVETPSSIFVIAESAFLGLVDLNLKTVAFYHIFEASQVQRSLMHTADDFSLGSSGMLSPISCKPNSQLLTFKNQDQISQNAKNDAGGQYKVCYCNQGYYEDDELEGQIYINRQFISSCRPCNKGVELCKSKPDKIDPCWGMSQRWDSTQNKCISLKTGYYVDPTTKEFYPCEDELCVECSVDGKSCIGCSLSAKLDQLTKKCVDCTLVTEESDPNYPRAAESCYHDDNIGIIELDLSHLKSNPLDAEPVMESYGTQVDIGLKSLSGDDQFFNKSYSSSLFNSEMQSYFLGMIRFYLVPVKEGNLEESDKRYLAASGFTVVQKDYGNGVNFYLRYTLKNPGIDSRRFSHLELEYGQHTSFFRIQYLSFNPLVTATKVDTILKVKGKRIKIKSGSFVEFDADNFEKSSQKTQSLILRVAETAARTSFAVFLKYFQIVDFLMNFFNKINVDIGEELREQVEFLNVVQFPKIQFLENWSLTQDGGQDKIDSYLERKSSDNYTYFVGQESKIPVISRVLQYQSRADGNIRRQESEDFLAFQNQTRIIETSEEISDRPQSFQSPSTESQIFFLNDTLIKDPPPQEFFIFQTKSRNTKKLLVKSNKDLFIVWGQNGLISGIVIISYLATWVGKLGLKKNKAVRAFVFLQRQLIVIFFVQFQFLSLTELAMHKIDRESEARFIISYILSLLMISITTIELVRARSIVSRQNVIFEKLEAENYEEALIFKYWTDSLEEKEKTRGSDYSVRDKIRWSVFQILVVGLQMNSVLQISLIVGVDAVYLAFAFKDIRHRRVFKNFGVRLKYIFQEIAILVFLLVIAIFSYLQNTEFKATVTYTSMQRVVIVMVVIAIVSEALSAAWSLVCCVDDFLKERKAKQAADRDNKIAKQEEQSRMQVAGERMAPIFDEEVATKNPKEISTTGKQWRKATVIKNVEKDQPDNEKVVKKQEFEQIRNHDAQITKVPYDNQKLKRNPLEDQNDSLKEESNFSSRIIQENLITSQRIAELSQRLPRMTLGDQSPVSEPQNDLQLEDQDHLNKIRVEFQLSIF